MSASCQLTADSVHSPCSQIDSTRFDVPSDVQEMPVLVSLRVDLRVHNQMLTQRRFRASAES